MSKRVKLCITNDTSRMMKQLRIEYPTMSGGTSRMLCGTKEKAQEKQIQQAKMLRCDWHSNIIESKNSKDKWFLIKFTY